MISSFEQCYGLEQSTAIATVLPTAAAHIGLEADWRRHRCLGVWWTYFLTSSVKAAHLLFRGILTGSGVTISSRLYLIPPENRIAPFP